MKQGQTKKTMPMRQQAGKILRANHLDFSSRHAAKIANNIKGTASTGKLHSPETMDKYKYSLGKAGEWARNNSGIEKLKELTPEIGNAYLKSRIEDKISQTQLSADRNAIEIITGKNSLNKAKSIKDVVEKSKYYSMEQLQFITDKLATKYILPTELARDGGLRAHELLTLRPYQEGQKINHREDKLVQDKFLGRDGKIYITDGKGGLPRAVMFNHDLANRLDALKREQPIIVIDRHINYTSYYNLAGGQAFSKAFDRASKSTLGFSDTAHGLRHSYAKDRMKELTLLGKPYKDSLTIVSQELGHFRPEITEIYLK